MKLKTILAALCATFLLAGCEESLDDQMTEYMEFYYPSSGAFWYDIAFDWGSYLITNPRQVGTKRSIRTASGSAAM